MRKLGIYRQCVLKHVQEYGPQHYRQRNQNEDRYEENFSEEVKRGNNDRSPITISNQSGISAQD